MTAGSKKRSGSKTIWIILAVCLVAFGVLAAVVVMVLGAFGYVGYQAKQRSNDAQLAFELEQVNTALGYYKESRGEFPPEIAPDQLRRHTRRAWPRYTGDMATDLKKVNLDTTRLDAREALVFWLGGLPSQDGAGLTTGWDRDPQDPFQRAATSDRASRTRPIYVFDPSRLTDSDKDGWLEYAAVPTASGELRWLAYDAGTHRAVVRGTEGK